jgi:hypothetical protein
MSHSSSRVAHRGGRSETDPDRRVKYVLRYVRRGGAEEARTQLVRRHRRRGEREVAAGQVSFLRRLGRRRDRFEARRELRAHREGGVGGAPDGGVDGAVDDTGAAR